MKILEKLLREQIEKYKGQKVGVLFSGGIDSSIIAKLCSEYCDATCYVAGTEGAKDFEFAERTAEDMNFRLKKIIIKDASAYAKKVKSALNSTDLIDISVGIVIYACCEKADERIIFTGAGGDELFLGYDRFRRAKDIKNEQEKAIKNLLEKDMARDAAIAEKLGKKIIAPLCFPKIIEMMKKTSSEQNLAHGKNKIMLRKLGNALDLPEYITNRPKKAAQYGSGVGKKLLQGAKAKGIKISEYLYSL